MTGRDLIIYILENGLENEPVFKDGRLLGFMNTMEAAIKYEVGVCTVTLWVQNGQLPGLRIGKEIYIPENAPRPSNMEVIVSNCI